MTISPESSIEEAAKIMREYHVGDLVGIASANDISTFLSSELSDVTKIIPRQKVVEIQHRPKF